MDVEGGGAAGAVVTNGDDGKGGGCGAECLHHPCLSNNPLSELSSNDVTQPNCRALERRVMFALIVMKPRWRLLQVATWLDAGGCVHTHTEACTKIEAARPAPVLVHLCMAASHAVSEDGLSKMRLGWQVGCVCQPVHTWVNLWACLFKDLAMNMCVCAGHIE